MISFIRWVIWGNNKEDSENKELKKKIAVKKIENCYLKYKKQQYKSKIIENKINELVSEFKEEINNSSNPTMCNIPNENVSQNKTSVMKCNLMVNITTPNDNHNEDFIYEFTEPKNDIRIVSVSKEYKPDKKEDYEIYHKEYLQAYLYKQSKYNKKRKRKKCRKRKKHKNYKK